jgi:uncharacterized membrane protein
MNTQTNTEVQHYLDAMREALSDLPAAEVGEIMDDAGAHVVEVAEEMGDEFTLAALTDRLGTPQAYAQELRAAADYPAPTPAAPTSIRPMLVARFALWSLVAGTVMAFAFATSRGDGEGLTLLVGLVAAVGALLVFRQKGLLADITRLPETVALNEALQRAERSEPLRVFLTSLRAWQPAWWVGRALLIAGVGMLAYRVRSPIVLVLMVLAALSLLAGPKAKTDRRWLWISLPATGFAIGGLLLVLASMTSWLDYRPSSPVSYTTSTRVPDNIYVFDKDGKPLTDVHLYDEDGQPLNTPWHGCNGSPFRDDNRFPRPQVVHDQNGCREIPGVPPFTIVIPGAAPTVTTTPPTTPPSVQPSVQPTTQSVPPTAVVPTT